MQQTKDKLKPLKIIAKILIIFICIIIIFLTAIRMGEKFIYLSFYQKSKIGFSIPGKSSGFVGQGLDYVDEEGAFITCGYSANEGEASSVYVIYDDGKKSETKLLNADGSNYTGHTGGIAHYKDYIYITGDDGCDVFSLSDLMSGSATTKKLGEVKTFNDPAFCNIKDGKFYSGSFYRKGNYETPEEHRLTTPAGDNNTALMTVFDIDDSAEFYINPTPTAAYSLPALVQGMTFTNSQIVLSTSYGLASSHLYFYDISNISTGQFTINDTTVPLYYLDSASLADTVTAPPMSEEIVYKDGYIYIMTESASNKYIFGKLMSGVNLYAYKV